MSGLSYEGSVQLSVVEEKLLSGGYVSLTEELNREDVAAFALPHTDPHTPLGGFEAETSPPLDIPVPQS